MIHSLATSNVRWMLTLLLASGCVADAADPAVSDSATEAASLKRDDHMATVQHSNATGSAETVGPIDHMNPFFRSLGTNGRACVTCHQEDQGFTITPAGVQSRFLATAGTDPLFRLNDGANSPNADVSTQIARGFAYSMLLTRGVIRIGLPIPVGAEFTLDAVDDPYHFASASELSLFRRPPPSSNLSFLSAIMWDGREASLASQVIDATLGHAQATSTNQTDMAGIVSFELGLFTAQATDSVAGDLSKAGGLGGAQALSATPFFIGINDPLGFNPEGTAFDPRAFRLFDGFAPPAKPKQGAADQRRYAIFRGQQIFNTRPISIAGVKGLNDFLGVDTVQGTCTTCHDTPNVGNHSVKLALDIGLTTEARRTPDMPLYTLRNTTTGEIIKTTDPGRALITGKWADVSKFKGPILRGLSARAPYFHNGSATRLDDVVGFYETRFGLGLSAQERSDLVAFLQAL
jgi:cytochrome c peroxidase